MFKANFKIYRYNVIFSQQIFYKDMLSFEKVKNTLKINTQLQ